MSRQGNHQPIGVGYKHQTLDWGALGQEEKAGTLSGKERVGGNSGAARGQPVRRRELRKAVSQHLEHPSEWGEPLCNPSSSVFNRTQEMQCPRPPETE